MGKILRLVQEEDRIAPLTEIVEKKVIEGVNIILFAFSAGRHLNIEFLIDGLKELFIGDKRIKDKSALCGGIQMRQEMAAQGRFACADTACYGNESFSFIDPIKQVVERFFMVSAQEKEPGIGCQVKWIFFEAKK